MPLINADFKQLEWVCAVFLSKDLVGYREIRAGFDQHEDNLSRLGLPDRLTAKRFIFKLIFGGTPFGYANDSDFLSVGGDERFWQGVIDKFYLKYEGIKRWHDHLMEEVLRSGMIVIPTGRRFTYSRLVNGDLPRTTILNYPVQGLGAELMLLCRLLVKRLLVRENLASKVLMCSTIHDSLILDSPKDHVENSCRIIKQAWEMMPKFFEESFGVPFDLPVRVEIKVGMNLRDMEEV